MFVHISAVHARLVTWIRLAFPAGPRHAALVLALGSVVSAAAAFFLRWLAPEFLNDHFVNTARAHQMLLGEWPVRDFVDPGLPLMYAVSAAVDAFVRVPLLTEALVVSGGFAIAAASSFRLGVLATGSALLALAATLLQVAFYPRSYGYPKLLIYALALTAGWWAIERLGARRLAVLAAVTALGYYFRHDHGVYVGLGMLALLAVHGAPAGWKPAVKTMGLYAGFTLALILPHLVWVQTSVGLRSYAAMAADFSRLEAADPRPRPGFAFGPSRQPRSAADRSWVNVRWTPGLDDEERARLEARYGLLPLEHRESTTWRYRLENESPENIRAIRTDPHVDDTHGLDRPPPPRWREELFRNSLSANLHVNDNSLALLYWGAWLLPLAGLAMLIRGAGLPAGPVPEPAAKLAMLVTLALCVNAGFLREPIEARLADIAMPHTVLGAWLLAAAWRAAGTPRARRLRRSAAITAALLVALAIAVSGSTVERVRETGLLDGAGAVAERWRSVNRELRAGMTSRLVPRHVRDLAPFLRYVQECTRPGDRLLYAGFAPEVYVLAGRGFAAGHATFTETFHARAEEQELSASRLRQQSVPFVIMPARNRSHFQEVFHTIWAELEPRYLPMTTIEAGGREVEILIDAARTSFGAYGPQQWPCLVPRSEA